MPINLGTYKYRINKLPTNKLDGYEEYQGLRINRQGINEFQNSLNNEKESKEKNKKITNTNTSFDFSINDQSIKSLDSKENKNNRNYSPFTNTTKNNLTNAKKNLISEKNKFYNNLGSLEKKTSPLKLDEQFNKKSTADDKYKEAVNQYVKSKAQKGNILDTAGLLGTKLAEGAIGVYEGIADAGAAGLKVLGKATSKAVNNPVGKFIFGEDASNYENNPLYQIGEQMTKDKVTHTISKKATDKFKEKSLVSEDSLASQVASGVGQVVGMALNPLGVKNSAIKLGSKSLPIASGTKTMFMSTLGNSYTKAKEDGADDEQAIAYGLLSALKESASESMYGGLGKAFGKGALDDVVKDKVSSLIKNKVGKKVAELGIGMTAEGLEEVASSLAEPFIQRVYKDKEDIDPITFDSLLNDFVGGALVSGVMQGVDSVVNINRNNTIKNNVNSSEFLNQNITDNSNNNQIGNNNNNSIFSNQIDEVLNGTFPKRNMLTISENTPQILQEIGLKDLPITMTQKHLETITKDSGQYKGANYHNLGIDLVKQLPNAISNPLNILKSNTDNNSIVVITELADNQDRPVIASIKIDGKGMVQGIKIDSNVLTSAYGRNNYDKFMKDNIAKGNLLYDIDEGIIKKVSGERLQLTTFGNSSIDNNSINDSQNKKTDVADRVQFPMRHSSDTTTSDIPKNISPFSINNNSTNNSQSQIAPLSINNNMQQIQNNTKNNIYSTESSINNTNNQEIPKDPTKESSYDNVDNYNVEINNIKNILSKYTSLERSELISEKTYDSINGELRSIGKDLDDKTIDNLTNKIFKNLIDGKDIKNITNTVYNSINNPRKAKINEYRKLASNMIDDISTWNDKKLGISYQTETMKRNLYDIIPDKNKAKQVYETYFQTISENEATAKQFINEYNDKIKKLNLNNKESIAVQMYGEYKYNPETTLTGLQVDEYIEKNNLNLDKIKNSVEVFRDTYDELINKVNNVLIEQGYKPIEYRKGYFPHFVTDKPTSIIGKFSEKLGWKINKDNLPTDIAGMSDLFKPGKRWTSFSQQRTGDSTDYNALKGFDTYIRGAADLIYHTEDIQKLRALENEIRYQYASDTIKKEIDNINNDGDLDTQKKQEEIDKIFDRFNNQMPNFVTEIRRYTDGLANKKAIDDRNIEHKLNREIYSVMTNIENRVNANMVGLNVSSAFTNFIPITQGYSQISSKNMLKAIKDTISNQVNNDGFENRSTFLTNRLKNPDNLYKTGLDKINDKASFLFEGIDSVTSNILVRGKYYDNINNGMSESEAIKNADEFAKDVMAGRSKGEMPTIYNEKNFITKLFTSFQLEVKNQYGYMFKDIPRDLKDKGMKTLISAFMKMYLGAWIYNKFADSLIGRKSAFSPIDIVEETISTTNNKNLKTFDKVENITKNALQEIPYVGGLLGGGRLPINAAIPDVKTFEYFVNSFSDDKGKRKSAIDKFKKEISKPVLYLVTPFGGGQIKKTYEGLKTIKNKGDYNINSKGEKELKFPVENPKTSDYVKATLFGKYALPTAKDYINNGFKKLSAKKTMTYEKAGIPYEKYKEYAFAKLTKKKDKIDFINKMDLTDKQKFELYKNDIFSSKIRKDGSSQVKDAERAIKGISIKEYLDYYNHTVGK